MKNTKIELRISAEEKQLIKDYCEEHDLTVSEFIRNTVMNKIIIKGENE